MSDLNVGSIMLVLGTILVLFSAVFASGAWIETVRSGVARTPGTVTVAFVPLIMGFQLLLNALIYDVQFSPKVHAVSIEERHELPAHPLRAVANA